MNTIYWTIEYAATFTECFLCSIFCGIFIGNTDLRKNFGKRLMVSIVLSFVIIIYNNKLSLYSAITAIITVVLYCIAQIIIYYKNPVKASFFSIIYLLMLSITDNIVVSAISYSLKIATVEIYGEMSPYRVIAILCSKVSLMFFTLTISRFFKKKPVLPKKYTLLLFLVTISMLFFSSLIALLDMKNNSVNSYVSIMFFIVMLILLITAFLGIYKLAEYYENKQQFKLIALKNHMLEQSLKETEHTFMLWKTNMHDYKHNIINLMSLAEKNDMQGIKKYLEKENELLGKKLFYYKTGNDTVDAMLYIKQKKAEKNGILFVINANVPKNCPLSSQHLASILGNLLDNAIEASINEENPFIEIKINELAECFWIVISNRCKNPNVSLKTSKKDKHLHGFGINSVKRITKNYNGEISINTENNKFEVRIMIPMQKSK